MKSRNDEKKFCVVRVLRFRAGSLAGDPDQQPPDLPSILCTVPSGQKKAQPGGCALIEKCDLRGLLLLTTLGTQTQPRETGTEKQQRARFRRL